MSLDLNGLQHLWTHIMSRLLDKVDKSDIVDNLTTENATKPLSAAQGVALKALISSLESDKLDAVVLPTPTVADTGKFLRVSAEGKYELVSIPNAEEATF